MRGEGDNSIHLVAIVTARSGQRANLLAAIQDNRPAVLRELGCLEYQPLIDDDERTANSLGPDTVLVIERWADDAALAAHREMSHMLAYRERTRDMVISRSLHLLRAV